MIPSFEGLDFHDEETMIPTMTEPAPDTATIRTTPWRLRAERIPKLPLLAWVAQVDRLAGLVTLRHGAKVEVRDTFWIEGVWDGSFAPGVFGETECVFGSGGLLFQDSLRIVPSAATTDYLFVVVRRHSVTVSNSLPLLLASIEDELDLRYWDYAGHCDSILQGLTDYERFLPTRHGFVRRLMVRNLTISRDTIAESDKRMSPPFTCFADYRDYLRDRFAACAANARDEARTWPLNIISTQSKGYDSTAVNALAAPFGLDQVFTLPHAKSYRHLAHQQAETFPDDDGGEICATLGLHCTRLDRQAYTKSFDDEVLYYCALHHNQDVNLKDLARHVSGVSLLLTGTMGEIWYPLSTLGAKAFLDADLRRWDFSGHGLSEWRLVVGLVHLPMPYIGARRRPEIVAITESAEMNPWRVKGKYDRPIPRRIAEEAGVPRSFFGQSKMGSVVLFTSPAIPYGAALRREFFADLVTQKIMTRPTVWLWPVVRWWNTVLQVKTRQRYALVDYAEAACSKLLRRPIHFPPLWSKFDGTLFCWCVNRTAAQLRKDTLATPIARLEPAIDPAQILPIHV